MRRPAWPVITVEEFNYQCQFLWGFTPTHPETAWLAAEELRNRKIGSLPGPVRMQYFGLTEAEAARAPNLANRKRGADHEEVS